MIELKPCPFCGGEARIERERIGEFSREFEYIAVCTRCSGNSGWDFDAEQAAVAWNRRV